MSSLLVKRIKRITVRADYIRSHPWRSPFGLAKAIQIFSRKIMWEGRFKSLALLVEKALLTCMAYVDLNPIRAKMAPSVDESEYTSVFERIHGKSHHAELGSDKEGKDLVKFTGAEKPLQPASINFTLIDYLELVDYSLPSMALTLQAS